MGATPTTAPAPAPGPVPDGDGGTETHWSDSLLMMLELLCFFIGCSESRTADLSELSAAIHRLSVSVTSSGVPVLSDQQRREMLNTVLAAAAVADEHAGQMKASDYNTLTATLDAIAAELASGRPQ